MQHHSQQKELGEGRGRHSVWWCLSSQVTSMSDGALLSWRWLNICLPLGSSEWIPCFALHVHTAFALPIKLSLSQPMSFCTFTLPISPHPTGGGVPEWLCRAELLAGIKPWQNQFHTLAVAIDDMISSRLQKKSVVGAAICWDLNYLIYWVITGKMLGRTVLAGRWQKRTGST